MNNIKNKSFTKMDQEYLRLKKIEAEIEDLSSQRQKALKKIQESLEFAIFFWNSQFPEGSSPQFSSQLGVRFSAPGQRQIGQDQVLHEIRWFDLHLVATLRREQEGKSSFVDLTIPVRYCGETGTESMILDAEAHRIRQRIESQAKPG